MRPPVDEARLRAFARGLAEHTRTPMTLYLTGGSTAVLFGWRETTVDIDIRVEPDLDEAFRALPRLKLQLDINVETASPPDFIPELDGWRERSPIAFTEGSVTVRHFDPYSQALAKIERGFAQDLDDVRSMARSGLIETARLLVLFAEAEERLFRYPAINPREFRDKVEQAVAGLDGELT
ncbi:MAG: DUF6036 family nucleotidyltransferase [Baekduia sp.]